MARAKSTHRAEARRRYRAQLAESEGALADEAEDAVASTTSARPGTPSTPAPPPARPSLVYAFRTSFRQANVREDVAYLPTLVVGTKAVWLPVGLSIGTAVLAVLNPNQLTSLAFQYFVLSPPIGALFLAGFLAPRASYFAGVLVGTAALAIFVMVIPTGVVSILLPGVTLSPTAPQLELFAQGLPITTTFGALVAASAAWYKRFLRLANPNRGARRQPARGKPAPRRR